MDNMYRKRYGKYPIKHTINFLLLIFLLTAVLSFFSFEDVYLGLFLLIITLLLFIHFYYPFREKFYITDKTIHRKKGRQTEEITIPDNAVFVLSYTITNFIYRKKYTVNIIAEDAETTLDKLHKDDKINRYYSIKEYRVDAASYGNKTIENYFHTKCIYSFLYEKNFADEFFSSQKKTVIIPRTIYDKLSITPDAYTIIVDENG